MALKICLDAGHYGKYNQSPVVPGYYEAEMTWKLTMLQKEILEGYGCEVILTRDDQAKDRKVYDRGYAAKGCDLFLSNHSNACATEGVDYPVVYRAYDNRGNADMLALQLARAIEAAMGTQQAGRTAIRKGKSDDEYYGVMRGARAAGLDAYYIVEHSFHTNAAAAKWLMDDNNLRKLAQKECAVIASYYGLDVGGPETDTTDRLTLISGPAQATAAQMRAYIRAKNGMVGQDVMDMLPLYIAEGELEDIRGDLAFAQSCIETGNYTYAGSAVTPDQHNYCGMGVTKRGEKGNSFPDAQLGIRAQIQHLKAYAMTSPLNQECVDPRFRYVERGCAPYVEWLGIPENPQGKGWAAGAGYGEKLLRVLEEVLQTHEDAGQEADGTSDNPALPYLVTTTCDTLYIRSGAGKGYPVVGQIAEPEEGKKQYNIVEERDGWGRLKSGAGWICLDYTERVGGNIPAGLPYLITTSCDVLNIRSGAGKGYPVVGQIAEPAAGKKQYNIVEERDGWGRLKSGAGWISLQYTRRVS